jgi:hypothetical protein
MENVNSSAASQSAVRGPGWRLKDRLGPKDMMEAFDMPEGTYYRHQREGKFDRFLLPRPIGVKRYSRRLVEAYLDWAGR